MAVSHTLVVPLQISSALAALQERSIRGERLLEQDIVSAIEADIASGTVVSEVFLSKFVASNRSVSVGAIESLICQLQAKMSAVLLNSPDLFLSYGKATAFLARELRRRTTALHLV
jgi:hypothetical protein